MASDKHVRALRRAIKHSGLSAQAFARTVLLRDPRTVRRWLSGESPIPAAVSGKLDSLPVPAAVEGAE